METTNHNFKLWWNKLDEEKKGILILTFFLKQHSTDENPENIPPMEEMLEVLNKPIDDTLIENIKSINTFSFSSENNYNKQFNFYNIKYLDSLKFLALVSTNHFRGLKYLKKLENLEFLDIVDCKNIADFKMAPAINNPIYLKMSHCRKAYSQDLSFINNPQSFRFSYCNKLNFASSPNLNNIKYLEFVNCSNSFIYLDFKMFPNLISLKIIKTTGKIILKNTKYGIHIFDMEIQKSAIANPEELKNFPYLLTPKEEEVTDLKELHCGVQTISLNKQIKTTQTKQGILTSII